MPQNQLDISAYERLPIPFELLSSDGQTLFANTAYKNVFRSSLPRYRLENLEEAFANVAQGKEVVFPAQWLFLESKWAAYEAQLFVVEHTLPLKYGLLYKDVTKEQTLADELKEVSFYYERAEEVGLIGSWCASPGNSGELTWSKNTYKIFQCEESDFDGTVECFFKFVHPEDREAVSSAVAKSIATGEVYDVSHRIICKGGAIKWIHERGRLIPAEANRPERLFGVCRDITDRVMAQERLNKLNNRFRVLFDLNLVGFAVLSPEGPILEANDQFLKISGYSRQDIYEGRVSTPGLNPPEDAQLDVRYREQLATTGMCPPFEKQLIRKDGTRVPVLVGAARLTYEKSYETVVMVLDLSEIRQLQRKIEETRRLDSLGLLAGGIAHDFSSLLNVIILHLEQLMSSSADASLNSKLQLLLRHSEKAKNLIQKLLSFTRDPAGTSKPVDINEVIVGMQDIFERLLPKSIDLNFHLDSAPSMIKADSSQIEQILLNLVTNARDAMPRGGKLTIATKTEASSFLPGSTQCVIEVSDSGVGIPSESLGKIFDPFFSTKEFGKGTGLGLPTVYAIVKKHNGNIDVTSEPGRGTKFRVSFPAYNVSAADIHDLEFQNEELPATHILLVEDQEALREVIASILRQNGAQVTEANSGAHALELVEQNAGGFDLVITDVIMPEVSGASLSQKLPKHMPILFVSGYTNNELRNYGIEGNSGNFLAKPFTSKELLSKVKLCLEKRGPELTAP